MADNIVARIDATFENISNLDVKMSADEEIKVDLGNGYYIEKSHILFGTTAFWNNQPTLVANKDYLYVYTDYKQNEEEQNIAGFKVGDGTSYLIDLPFTDDIIYEEIEKIKQTMRDTSIDSAMYHLGFYLDEHGGLCQVNSI